MSKLTMEHVSLAALFFREVLALLFAALLTVLVLVVFRPFTWLWYLLLWLIGGVTVLVCTLYLPLAYLSMEYGVDRDVLVCRSGVFIRKTQLLYRDRIAFVAVYQNPLSPLFHVSTLVASAPGGNLRLMYLPSARAAALYEFLAADMRREKS